MKQISILFFVLLLLSCSSENGHRKSSFADVKKDGRFYDRNEEETGDVWICTGESSHAYHSNRDCYGLGSCRADIERISIAEAIEIGRTPCHYCHRE